MTYSLMATQAWKNLQQLAGPASAKRISDLFTENPNRAEEMSVDCGELHLDFSKNLVSEKTWQALLALAEQSPLEQHRAAMFSGEVINTTENRAVLHAALRAEIAKEIELKMDIFEIHQGCKREAEVALASRALL